MLALTFLASELVFLADFGFFGEELGADCADLGIFCGVSLK